MKFGRIGKAAWYLCGVILVLSLPTFSYLVPKPELAMGPGISQRADPPEAPASTVREAPGGSSVLSTPGRLGPSSFVSFSNGRPRSVPFPPPVAQPRPRPIAGASVTFAERGPLDTPRPDPRSGAAMAGRGPLSQQINQDSRGTAQRFYDPGSSSYRQDLHNVDQAYESAMGQLFNDYPVGLGYGGNPFTDALPDDKKTDTNGGDNGNSDGDGNNGDGNGNGGNGDGNDNGGDNPPSPPPDDGGPIAKRYPFLLIGSFEGVESANRVFRSYRENDGSYVIEDHVKVTPFPNIVGGGNQLLGFADNQQMLADDLDGDGRQDLLVTRSVSQGTGIDLFTRDVSGNFRKQASSFFLWKSVRSMAMLDFDADSNLDLALLFRDSSNLFIYRREGQEFKYLKEIVLPFEPSVVVDSLFEGFPRERRLHVFDASFHLVATLSSSSPGIFLIGLPGSQTFKSYKLDGEEDGPGETELQIFENSGGIALAEKRETAWVVVGRFSTTAHYPVVVFGDYLNTGTRQLFCVP